MGRVRSWLERLSIALGLVRGRDVALAARAAMGASDPEAMDPVLNQFARERLLRETGVETPAIVRRVALGAPSERTNGQTPIALDLIIEPVGGETYDVHVEQLMPDVKARAIAAGGPIVVRVAPGDPRCALVW